MTAARDQEPGQPDLAAETARRAALTPGRREAEKLIQQQLHAALFPGDAGNQELQGIEPADRAAVLHQPYAPAAS
jgi:hypothetical protein